MSVLYCGPACYEGPPAGALAREARRSVPSSFLEAPAPGSQVPDPIPLDILVGAGVPEADSLEIDSGSLEFDLGSLEFDLGSLEFDLGSLEFDLGSLEFDLGSLEFDSRSLEFD